MIRDVVFCPQLEELEVRNDVVRWRVSLKPPDPARQAKLPLQSYGRYHRDKEAVGGEPGHVGPLLPEVLRKRELTHHKASCGAYQLTSWSDDP